MDTSKEYIQMCREAEEMQRYYDIHLNNIYNWFYVEPLKQILMLEYLNRTAVNWLSFGQGFRSFQRTECTWLPRQDQLQEMISTDLNELVTVFFDEIKWGEHGNMISKNPMYIIGLKSMEQLWLAFVMKKKYNKTWNGTIWIEEE